ncbi:VOC family protein [Pseudoduganella namucuonensis]|uniref:Glyoxalase superfamily enzyme, possibly 3-demethylubiquinone-9 3-methyltransferase n=1 Tax=Pseudoduganella namucuonensis TaxID=1035707 RepID=A0A1I7JL55_9BURK|nr:VOC family protein [Pseudoduganella namucuonensis]SFU85919.1 Glyoxalase superfamily enzyme, possibly 3-demethylubiquinone-9 3-methyltransferase [Pseudoduganella namucuonensis]
MASINQIVPCLWFDGQAEDAANYYVGIFDNSKITQVSHYSEAGKEYHGHEPGTVLMVSFELNGQPFTAMNGGPQFRINEAISFQVMCESQQEVDRFWSKLTEGGPVEAQQCGWLKDKFGVSWQIVPSVMIEMLKDAASPKAQRAMSAMMQMKKLDIAELQRAYAG